MKEYIMFHVVLSAMFLFAASVPGPSFEKVPPQALASLRIAKGKMISTGMVFVNGKLLSGPYTVSRYGTAIKVNREQVTGQVVPWVQFTTAGLARPVPAAAATTPAATAPATTAPADDLFGDGTPPATPKKPVADAPASPSAPASEYVDNARTRALLKRINEYRTDIDRTLRSNGIFFFGVGYAPVRVEARFAKNFISVLQDALRNANDVRQLQGILRSRGITYLSQEVCADLMKDRTLFVKIRNRVREMREEQEFRKMLGNSGNGL